jgi:hypothetical protein
MLSQKQKQVEQMKLKTIGLRMQVEKQVEERKRKQTRLEATIFQKQQELERLISYADSLERTKREQMSFIETLHMK